MHYHKIRITLVVFILLFFAALMLLLKQKPKNGKELLPSYSLCERRQLRNSQYKVILVWSDLWGQENWRFSREPEKDFKTFKCEITNCVVTDNRTRLPEADAVMFHLDLEDRPSCKPSMQRWVYWSHEPISLYPVRPYHNLVNWVQSYRRDADIYMPYFNFCKRNKPIKIDYQAILKPKTKLAAWFVSKCNTSSRREDFVRKLMEYIPVDVYGKCSEMFSQNNVCSRKENCQEKILNNHYKFYLALENALFKDYVTEKYFKMLDLNIVPVVRGDGDYSVVGPPNSFINTKDFSSVRDLANYLLYLNKNDDEYIKFLKYKENYKLDNITGPGEISHCPGFDTGFCRLCKKLNDPNEPYKVYDNLEKWYGSERKPDDIK